MDGASFLYVCEGIAFAALTLAFALIAYRIGTGPTLPDRILGLDMLVSIAIGYIATFNVRTGYYLYVDIAIALGLVGFLSTVALARFVAARIDADMEGGEEQNGDMATPPGVNIDG